MEISYRKSNMVIKNTAEPLPFEVKMLEHNAIAGLLPFSFQMVNEETEMLYDISSKQMLRKILETERLTAKWLDALLSALISLRDELKEYFLDMDRVIFRADMIYAGTGSREIYFCFLPGYDGSANAGLKELFAELLAYLDTSDEQAVRALYSINKVTMAENFSLEDLRNAAQAQAAESRKIPALEQAAESRKHDMVAADIRTGSVYKSNDIPKPKHELMREQRPEAKEMRGEVKSPGLFEKIKRYVKGNNFLQILEDIDDGKVKEKVNEPRPEDVIIGSDSVIINKLSDIEVFEIEEGGTVLLSGEYTGTRFLEGCGAMAGKTVVIEETPFAVGKAALDYPAISRMHAEITEEKGEYFLEDLNSRNGTLLNGKRLDPFSPEKLKDGDAVTFADLNFYFR